MWGVEVQCVERQMYALLHNTLKKVEIVQGTVFNEGWTWEAE